MKTTFTTKAKNNFVSVPKVIEDGKLKRKAKSKNAVAEKSKSRVTMLNYMQTN